MNESVVSSSPVVLDRNKNNAKRSISSSLINFFNKIKHSNNSTHDQGQNEDSHEVSYELPRKKKKLGYSNNDAGYDSLHYRNNSNEYNESNGIDPIILYENDGTENIRPPVLPILPVQRLRLLKQRQMLRLRNESRLISYNSLKVDNNNDNINNNTDNDRDLNSVSTPDLAIPPQDYDQSVIIHKSGTPSPVKNATRMNELVLDSNNNIVNKPSGSKMIASNKKQMIQLRSTRTIPKKNKKFAGTKWSGDFEYDLSEYDIKPKQSLNVNSNPNNAIANSLSSNGNGESIGLSPKIPISKLGKFAESNQSKKLSKSKIDLLINGSKETTSSSQTDISSKEKECGFKTSTNNENKPSKDLPTLLNPIVDTSKPEKKPNVVLPTMGFDFIKDNETPSKKVSFSFNNNKKDDSNDTKEIDSSAKKDKSKALLFSFDKKGEDKSESTTAPKLSFSFSSKSTSTDINNDEEEGLKRKKPAVTIDMTKDINKPTFSFGLTKTDNKEEKSTENKTPSFNFGSIKPSVEETNMEKPKLSFGFSTKPQEQEADGATAAKKPTFSFGVGSNATSTDKVEREEDEDDRPRKKRPAFSFGTSATTAAPSTETKPSLSFGLNANKESEKKVEESKKAPSFSFGLSKPGEEKKTPSFAFGGAPLSTTATTATTTTTTTEEKKTGTFSFGTGSTTVATPIAAVVDDKDTKKPSLFSLPTNEKTANDKPSFSFGSTSAPAVTTITETKPSFSFGKAPEASKEKSSTPSFSFGARPPNKNDTNTSKPLSNPLLSKPPSTGLGVGVNNTTTSAGSAPSFSFGKPSENSTTQLNKEANSLGVSLTNPLLSKNNSFNSNATSNNSPSPATNLFSGASNGPGAITGGFKFSRPAPGVSTPSSSMGQQTNNTAGSSLFGGAANSNNNNNNTNNNNNSSGSFNFGFGGNNNSNPLLSNSNNNQMQTGGSVFSGGNNNSAGGMFGGNNTNGGGSSGFNFGQNQPPSQPQPPQQMFQPSNQINLQFNSNANANPLDIFSGSNNSSNPMMSGNVSMMQAQNNNNGGGGITAQPNVYQTRKIARMRQSRR